MRRWLPRTRPIGHELQLDVGKIIETVAALRNRIEERFPGSGLGSLAERLHRIASKIWQKLMILDRSLDPPPDERATLADPPLRRAAR